MQRSIDVIGVPELQQAFALLPTKIQGKVLRPGLRAGAKVFRDAVEAEAPRRTGALATHVHVRASKRRKNGNVGMIVITGTREELGIPEETKAGTPRGYYPTAIQYSYRHGRGPSTRFDGFMHDRKTGEVLLDKSGQPRKRYRRLSDEEFGSKRIPANPFMTRAFEGSKQDAIDAVSAEISRRIADLTTKAVGGVAVSEGDLVQTSYLDEAEVEV
jgi:HK97 gp10 family phage protein